MFHQQLQYYSMRLGAICLTRYQSVYTFFSHACLLCLQQQTSLLDNLIDILPFAKFFCQAPKNRWGLCFLVSFLIALVALKLAAFLLPSLFPEEPAGLVLLSLHSFFPAGLILPSLIFAFLEAPADLLLGLGTALFVLGFATVLLATPTCLLATSLAPLESFVLLQYLYLFYYNPFHYNLFHLVFES